MTIMSNAEPQPERSNDTERPSVDAPLAPDEWAEYRCRRCGEHCINRADGDARAAELCLDCLAAQAAVETEAVGVASTDGGTVAAREESTDAGGPTAGSPLRSVRSSLASVAARIRD
ncbi:hypothetical protein [Candidatus Halobonum tyrrellensis]|nr:hypothetical protein [Candidatus Halobonum tyrrellensis]